MVLALIPALLLPAAVQGEEDQAPSATAFQLQASNGYKFIALAVGGPDGEAEGSIGLYLVGKHTVVTYAAPATVSPKTIEADLGQLGEISVTRVPTGRMKTVRGCKPGSTKQVKAENYEGTIEFHGEEGFTEVNATSAPLLNPTFCATSIEGGGRAAGKSLPGARLDVEKDQIDHYRLEFDAVQRRPGARTLVSAEVEEHRGEMEIHRALATWASADALHYDRRLHHATVTPPAPFAGYGSFHAHAPRANQWRGNLTVDFPGHADVPVTGPGFWADLEHPRR
jgi:hypothetical protein